MTAFRPTRLGVPALLAASLISGCATVDLQSMSGTSAVQSAEVEAEKNIVQRSVETLRAAFASRGLGEKSSRMKMQAAADMLLNGLSAKTVSATDGTPYANQPAAVILEDIEMARTHIDRTTSAAEVYLSLARTDRRLDEELGSLQTALLVSERAGRVFSDALDMSHEAELADYKASVNALRSVTDGFGDRVRVQRSDKLALSAAAAS